MKTINLACLIDDDDIYIYGTKKILEIAGFCKELLVYKNGKEALDNLVPILADENRCPEVIFLDLNMPIMDGWQFLDEFVKIKSKRKITLFIVSSSIDPTDKSKAATYSEVTDYLVKPIGIDEARGLLDKVN